MLEPLSLSSESEKSPRLPLLASVAPELLLLTLLSPGAQSNLFLQFLLHKISSGATWRINSVWIVVFVDFVRIFSLIS